MAAVISARPAAFRAWLSQSAARYFAVGVLAAGVGIPATVSMFGTPAPAAPTLQSAAKADTNAARTSSPQAMGGRGPAVDTSQLSETLGDDPIEDGNVPATIAPASLGSGYRQGWDLSIADPGAASAPDGRIELLRDVGLYGFADGWVSNTGSGASRNRDSGTNPRADSGQSASTSDGATSEFGVASVPPASGDWGAQSNAALLGSGGPYETPADSPVTILADGAGSGSIDIARGLRSEPAARPARVFADLVAAGRGFHGQAQAAGGWAGSAAAGLSGGLLGVPNASGSRGVSEVLRIAGQGVKGSGLPGGVPEPSAWTFMLLGLALIGGSVRHRRAGASRRANSWPLERRRDGLSI